MAFPNELMQEQPESPRITDDGSYLRVERRYKVIGRFTQTQLEQGEYLPSSDYNDPETGASYVGWEYDSEVAYPVLVVRFEKRLLPFATYSAHEFSYERPIEQHPDFLMSWVYDLYASDNSTAVPTWASADLAGGGAQDKSDTVDSTVWRWSRRGAPSGFKYLRQEASKPGVTGYLVSGTKIVKRKVYSTLEGDQGANRWCESVGYLVEPLEYFGYDAGVENYLVRDYRIVEDRQGYSTTLEWLYAEDSWDDDIYSEYEGLSDDG